VIVQGFIHFRREEISFNWLVTLQIGQKSPAVLPYTKMNPVRFSTLKYMARSPAHYRQALIEPPKQTKAMRLGDALDALLFKTKEVRAFEGSSRRGKAWDKFVEDNPESVLLTTPEQEHALSMLASVQANSAAMDLLNGKCQQRMEWKLNGRDCAGTPDVVTPTRIVELKSTRSANPDWFPWDARKMGYHAQLCWYANGLNLPPTTELWIIAVESAPPYPVTLFKLTERAVLEGQKLWRLWFERLLVCEATDTWPAYTAAPVPFDTPDMEGLTLKIEGEDVEVE
jgi:hypothetical protein